MSKDAKEVVLCEVCGKPILEKDPFKMYEGYRHRKECRPGTPAWSAKFGDSDVTKMLSKKPPKRLPSDSPGKVAASDPIRRAIKEFCGREKYMRYMDTVNKNIECHWSVEAIIGGRLIKHSKDQGVIDPDLLYQQLTKGGK